MLEAPTRSFSKSFFQTILVCLGIVAGLSSCATTKEPAKTALIDDPDARSESSIPWNRPAKWESSGNMPAGLGGIGGGVGDPGSDF
jgi:hypothetical protein